MFFNNIRVAYRNFTRNKGYMLINMAGLSIGIATFMIIFVYVLYERDFDRFHEDYKRVYRLSMKRSYGNDDFQPVAFSSVKMTPYIREYHPQVDHICRMSRLRPMAVKYKEKKFYIEQVTHAEPEIFKVFSLNLLRGNPEECLKNRGSAVINTSIAKKLFGDEDPMGKNIEVDTLMCIVTGIYEDLPSNSHLQYNILLNYDDWEGGPFPDTWGAFCNTYMKVVKDCDIVNLDTSLRHVVARQMALTEESDDFSRSFIANHHLVPLEDIHFSHQWEHEIHEPGNTMIITVFSIIGILILVIACINYMNLATAYYLKRSREVGIRKTFGALRSNLIWQFLTESLLLAFLAHIIAMFLVEFSLPYFNTYLGLDIGISYSDPRIILAIIAIIILAGFLSGSYPALFLSSFSPAGIFRKTSSRGSGRIGIRRVLVVFQFTVSIILLISTIIIFLQLHYMNNKPLGFDKHQKLVMRFTPMAVNPDNYKIIKKQIVDLQGINGTAFSSTVPGQWNYRWRTWLPGEEEKIYVVNYYQTDHDFLTLMGIQILAGENWDPGAIANQGDAKLLINEEAVKSFGWETPENAIGKHIWANNRTVIGVFKNIHFSGLQNPIEPMGIFLMNEDYKYMIVDVNEDGLSETISRLQDKYEELFPNDPFLYFFLDQDFEKQYKSEKRLGFIFNIFTLLTLFIACLGLLGLASFIAASRTREIGIRKVNGAEVKDIILLLSRDFIRWVVIANIIAWPIAYVIMSNWLDTFAYHIQFPWWAFLLAGFFTLSLALTTSIYQSVKAARSNPVDAIRYE